MDDDDLAAAQSVIREFGYDTQAHCIAVSNACIRVGLMAEASEVILASKTLIDLLVRISGKDFLLVGVESP